MPNNYINKMYTLYIEIDRSLIVQSNLEIISLHMLIRQLQEFVLLSPFLLAYIVI